MESILTSIKKLLGIEEDYIHFDTDIIIHINSALMSAGQIGLGPADGFRIQDKSSTWLDFVGNRKDLESIKDYVYLKVKLVFDPPQMGYLVEAIKAQTSEIEWRLNVQVEGEIQSGSTPGETGSMDYNDLINKPQIESVTLQGNKLLEEIGVDKVSNEEISKLFK